MDFNRYKKAAEWFYRTVFQDESIRPREETTREPVPPLIRAARSLRTGNGSRWQSREALFIKQGKLLADYEDNYDYQKEVSHYYPTYDDLSDRELRAYFTWRTKLRHGVLQRTNLSYAYLYVYELINQIGVEDPAEGLYKLRKFRDDYGALDSRILSYLNRWILDYAIYYNLDPALLGSHPQVVFGRCLAVLEDVELQEPARVMDALRQLAPKWLERSKFYGSYREDCDAVIVRVLRRASAYCATRCKNGFVDRYFGKPELLPVILFQGAVFYDSIKIRDRTYVLDASCIYRCERGAWSVIKRAPSPTQEGKLNDLLKTIDSVMREEYGYRYPIKREETAQWLLRIIREETRGYLAEKEAKEAARKKAEAPKITIDFSQLAQIRRDAAATRDKLAVEEEAEPEPEQPKVTSVAPASTGDCPLSPPEYRLMQCLLYGRDYSWVQTEGYLLSVLLDGINDKLYDVFQDVVLDSSPAVVADYLADLKEMVRP